MTTTGSFVFVSILPLLTCLFLNVVWCKADDTSGSSSETEALKATDHHDSFPDIFNYLKTQDKFRFQYELNAIVRDKGNKTVLKSLLVDESFSFSLNTGRLLLDLGNKPQTRDEQLQRYNIFYWFRTHSYQENYWLRPFVCASARTKLEEEPFKHGLFDDMVDRQLGYLTSFTSQVGVGGFNLQGLAAIFAHSSSFGSKNKNSTGIERSQDLDALFIRDVDGKELSYKTKTGHLLDFYFPRLKQAQEVGVEAEVQAGQRVASELDLSGIEIKFSSRKQQQQQPPYEGQVIETMFTLLKATFGGSGGDNGGIGENGDDIGSDKELFQLPSGYSCRQNIVPSIPISASARLPDGSRMKYTYEVNVITSGDRDLNSLPNYESWSLPKPEDSLLSNSRINSSKLILLNDQFDKYIAVVSPTREDDSFSASTNQPEAVRRPSLTVWDFVTRRKHLVRGQYGLCDEPVGFKSTLFAASKEQGDMINHGNLNDQFVELQLSERISLKLNEDGLDLMTFTMQNRKNFAQLIEMRTLSPEELGNSNQQQQQQSDVYELTYEMSARDKISLVEFESRLSRQSEAKPLGAYRGGGGGGGSGVRLVSKYTYSRSNDLWTPKSSSLLFFNEDNSKLMLLIEIKLSHADYYEPWSYSRHLVDLSPCKRGYKQSAKLEVEFPLSRIDWELQFISRPHKFFRYALASHLTSVYKLTLVRIPSIEVRILEDRILLEAHLLDQSHLLADSTLLPRMQANAGKQGSKKMVNKEHYLSWLRRANRSIVAASARLCAEYCQQYGCQVYTYCKQTLSCFIFFDSTELSLLTGYSFGSIRLNSEGLECDAYRVLPARRDAAGEWRKRSWNLAEVLESFVESVVQPASVASDEWTNQTTTTTTSKREEVEAADLIEDATDLAKLSIQKPFVRVVVKADKRKPAKIEKLWPTFARYHYDNLQSNSLLVGGQANSFSLLAEGGGGANSNQRERFHSFEWQANYRIALGGFKLVELASIKHTRLYQDQSSQAVAINLAANDGYLALGEHQAEDCLRACSADTSCASFSYCTTPTRRGDSPSPLSAANCIISRLNQSGIDWLWSSSALELGGRQQEAQAASEDFGAREGLFALLGLEKDPDCTIMRRTFMDQFERLEVRRLSFYQNQSMGEGAGVLSVFKGSEPDDCASICLADWRLARLQGNRANSASSQQMASAATCLSFDFCQATGQSNATGGSCVLFDRHLVVSSSNRLGQPGEQGKGPKPSKEDDDGDLLALISKQTGELERGRSYCGHFVRNYLADFHRINNRKLAPKMRGLLIDNYHSASAGSSSNQADLLDENDAAPPSGATPAVSESAEVGAPSKSSAVAPEVHFESEADSDGAEAEESSISLAKCARLCEEEPECGAFEFCLGQLESAPSGLLERCALGNSETLELAPTTAGGATATRRLRQAKPRERFVSAMLQLEKSRLCSVYIYKSLSLVLGHKKKNLQRVAAELGGGGGELPDSAGGRPLDGAALSKQAAPTASYYLMQPDVWLMASVFFLFGFLVRLDLSGSLGEQFSFQRLRELSSQPAGQQLRASSRRPAAREREGAGEPVGGDMIRLEQLNCPSDSRVDGHTHDNDNNNIGNLD